MKQFTIILLSAMLLFSLSACDLSPIEEIQAPETVVADTPSRETTMSGKEAVTIEQTVLLDEAGVRITAKELNLDGFMGPEIKLLIENNSGKDLTFQCRNVSINGYMIESMMSVDVVNGKKANDVLCFFASDLEACGIQTIADIEFSFAIFTSDKWEDFINTPQIQLSTSVADTYVYSFDDSGHIAYEGNGIRIVAKGLVEDESIFGPGIVVYIENLGSRDVTVQTRDVSVNGFMVDTMFSSDVLTDKRAINTITFLESTLEENKITTIESVELSFSIFDMNDWETIVDTEVITIAFSTP